MFSEGRKSTSFTVSHRRIHWVFRKAEVDGDDNAVALIVFVANETARHLRLT